MAFRCIHASCLLDGFWLDRLHHHAARNTPPPSPHGNVEVCPAGVALAPVRFPFDLERIPPIIGRPLSMAKLVIQNQGMTGRVCELHTDRTTIGRVEDNTFQIADSSVSSHHCEVHLRGSDIFIRDLNSTNGSFINGNKIEESLLKNGQTLRLGQVELKLESEGAPASAPSPASGENVSVRKSVDATLLIPRGVTLNQLEQGGTRVTGFDTNAAFSKKTNRVNKYFIIFGVFVAVVIIVLLVFSLSKVNPGH